MRNTEQTIVLLLTGLFSSLAAKHGIDGDLLTALFTALMAAGSAGYSVFRNWGQKPVPLSSIAVQPAPGQWVNGIQKSDVVEMKVSDGNGNGKPAQTTIGLVVSPPVTKS